MSPGSSSDGDSDLLGCYAVSTGESYRCFEELWCLSSGWSILETCLFEYEPESTRLIRKFRLYQSTVCDILEYMNHKKVFHCSRTFYSPVRRRNSSFGLVIHVSYGLGLIPVGTKHNYRPAVGYNQPAVWWVKWPKREVDCLCPD